MFPCRGIGIIHAHGGACDHLGHTEYEAESAFVTTAVFATTLLSPLTLTPLLLVLGA